MTEQLSLAKSVANPIRTAPSKRAWTPIRWATAVACLLSGILVLLASSEIYTRFWFGSGLMFVATLAVVIVTWTVNQAQQAIVTPILWAAAALGLWCADASVAGASYSAMVWPLLGAAAAGVSLSNGLAASLCVGVMLAILSPVLPAPEARTAEGLVEFSTIGVSLAITGTMTLAVCLRVGGVIERVRASAQAMTQEAARRRDLAQAEAQLAQRESHNRARFMAEMSHEIRTPLNAILGFADTMREGVFGPLPKGYEDYPGLIHTSGSHLLDLVSDLLDMSKIEAGRYEVQLGPIRLDQFLFEAIALSSGSAQVAGVQIRHEVGPAIEVVADSRAMRQIAFNLVSNAIKFTPKGGLVTLRIRLDEAKAQATFEVQDDGAGMSAADLARIGEPWAQGDNEERANSRVVRGSGLGLAVVKRLVELQGGRFWLESTVGQGTVAKVSLPVCC
jgi:signal transduction histidine kinase